MNLSAAGNCQRFKDRKRLVSDILLIAFTACPHVIEICPEHSTVQYMYHAQGVGETCEIHKTYGKNGKTGRTRLNL